jgi:hypothetical protein
MVRRALLAGTLALLPAAGAGWLAAGSDGAWSAGLGIAVVVLNFAAHGLSLAWAAGISIPAVHAVALGGFVVRMGVIVAMLFLLDRTAFFSPVIFGLAAVSGTLALLVYEARLVAAGLGGQLDIPADPAAAEAHRDLRARESAR